MSKQCPNSFVSNSPYLPEHSLWLKHRACVGIIESVRMILTDELAHLLWVLIASLVWFYSVGLWSAIIRKAIQSHLQRTIVDRWKVLTDEREQKYEGVWISSSHFLHVWNDVWSPPECGCRSVWLMPSTPTFYPHFPLSAQLCSVGRSRKCPVRGTVGFHNCHLYPLEPVGFLSHVWHCFISQWIIHLT